MVTKNGRALELKLGKLGLLLFVGGMSALLFSAFLLGLLVGKHLDAYPERYPDGLVDLVRGRFSGLAMAPQKQTAPPSGEERANSGGHVSEEEAFDLTFYKTLGDKKSGNDNSEDPGISDGVKSGRAVAAALPAAKNNPLSDETPPVGDVSGNAATAKSALANRASGGETGKPVLPEQKRLHAESASPESSPLPGGADSEKTVKKGNFQVQVAAYRDVSQAKKMEKRLKSLGFAAMTVPKDIPGKGRWFRVIAMDFDNRQKAESAALQIAGKIKGVQCIIRRNKGGEA